MKNLYLIPLTLILAGCVSARPLPISNQLEAASTPAPLESQSVTTASGSLSGKTSDGRNVEIIGGDEESLREFIQRWLMPIYPGATGGEPRVFIGSLPEDLPVEVPLPAGARIVAAIQEPESFNQIILDVNLAPEEITEYYAKALPEKGWRAVPQDSRTGGFVVAGDIGERYCHDEDKAYLEVWSVEKPDGPTDVRLILYAKADTQFCQEPGMGYLDQGMNLIPGLEAPPGARMTSGGSGGSSDGSSYVSTNLETSLNAGEILEHYNPILKQAGWEQVDQGLTEVVAWSAWRLRDDGGEAWSGTLIVMESRLAPESRFALLSVEKVP